MPAANGANGSVYPPYYQHRSDGLPAFVREGEVEYPFEDVTGVGDENKMRGNWSAKLDFVLSAIAFTVGLGNLWRFPYYCYIGGGSAFLVPYFIMLFVVGMPLFCLELALGQFASLGCVAVWKVCPMFKGIGISMVMVCGLTAVYYNVVSAWAIFFIRSSVSLDGVPWSRCDVDLEDVGHECLRWSAQVQERCAARNLTMNVYGDCVAPTLEQYDAVANLTYLVDQRAPSFHIENRTLPSEEFFHFKLLMLSGNIDEIGWINWELALYLLATWIFTFFGLFKGVKSSGKLVYITATLPYIILLVFLVRALTMQGGHALDGLIYFSRPQWHRLLDPKVWGYAASQVFFSLCTCWGGLITLSSYNPFHNNVFRDMWLITIADALTCIFAAAVSYALLGFLAHELGQADAGKLLLHMEAGPKLAFVMYAEVISRLQFSPLWSVLFFGVLICVGIDTQLVFVETVVTAICDEFAERLRRNHRHVLTFACIIFYALSVLFCTSAGIYLMHLLEYFTTTWTLLLIGFFETVVIGWVYGVDNLLDNVKWMVEYYPPPYIFWKVMWKVISPATLLAILVFNWVTYAPVVYNGSELTKWALVAGWTLSFLPIAAIPVTALVQICLARGSFMQRITDLLCPDSDWGPALAVHRAEQFPLQIPESRLPLRNSKFSQPMGFGLDNGIREVDDDQVPLDGDLPHFDRETAI